MTTARDKLLERDLAGPVKAFLESRGLTPHEEVRHRDAAGIWRAADIVAIDDRLTVAVEMKLTHSTELLAQAVHWLDLADLVWIALPVLTSKAPLAIEARRVAIDYCFIKGIGVLEVRKLEKTEAAASFRGLEPSTPLVAVVHEPERQHGRNVAEIRDQLRQEHRDGSHAGAGSKTGARVSKTNLTYQEIRVYLAEHGGRAPLDGIVRAFEVPWIIPKVKAAEVPCIRYNGSAVVAILELVEPGREGAILSERSSRTAPRERRAYG